MGSVSYHRPRGESNREHFGKEFPEWEILADHTVNGVWYAAVRTKDKPEEVFAAVFKIQWTRDYFNFTVKHMDETVGPGYHDAPAKVLDLLTPTEYEYANEWRARCRETIAAKAANKAKRASVTAGTVIVADHPLFFGKRYGHATRFRYTGNKNTFFAPELNTNVNLGKAWPSYTIETPQEVPA